MSNVAGTRRDKNTGKPVGFIHPYAIIGQPPEHRDFRWNELQGLSESLAPIIDPTAIVEAFATVDAGLQRHTTVGKRVMLMKHSHVGHDAVIGDDCNVAPGALIGGHCIIGDRVKIGMGAMIRPRTWVGDDAVIGMGAVVVKSVPRGQTWVGNPAGRILNKTEPLLWTPEEEYDCWMDWWESWHR